MSLACDCGDYDGSDGFYAPDNEEQPAPADTKCIGCCGEIKKGDEILIFRSYEWEYEEDDKDADPVEIEKTRHYTCEKCTGIYWSLTDLGFCLGLDMGFITEALREYHQDYLGLDK